MKYNIQKSDVPVEYYLNDVEKGKFSYPPWQREDCWSLTYKQTLILSIINGIDIPKIYIAKIKGTNDHYIMDGGHRTRAIQEYRRNEFFITNKDGKEVYYSKHDKKTRNYSILNDDARRQIDSYGLSIVTYIDIEENESRDIFNYLQNARPMDIEDVINSYESFFIDYIRDFIKVKILGKTVEEHFKEINGLKAEKTHIMTQLVSWFSIINPNDDGNDIIKNAYSFITKGNKHDSPLLDDFIKKKKNKVTDDEDKRFREGLNLIINYINESEETKITHGDIYTYIHSYYYIPKFHIEKYRKFIRNAKLYKNLKDSACDLNRNKDYKQAEITNKQADKLNKDNFNNLEKWNKSKKNGGNNKSGMKTRFEIMKEIFE